MGFIFFNEKGQPIITRDVRPAARSIKWWPRNRGRGLAFGFNIWGLCPFALFFFCWGLSSLYFWLCCFSCTYLIKFCRLKLLHANLSIYQLCRFCFTFLHYFRLQLTRYFNGYLVAKSDFCKDLAKFSVWCGRVGPFFYLIPDVFSFLSFFLLGMAWHELGRWQVRG